MGTIAHNLLHWGRYDWSRRGDEWSERWGGSENLWRATVLPRIAAFLPASHALEIAPGAGRMTAFLAPLCRRLTLIELTPECLEICRRRFAELEHVDYLPCDGKSLRGVATGSVDFVFSFDSLVHADRAAVGGYLSEIARVLTSAGAAFLHHSNLGELVPPGFDELSPENVNWRDASVSCAWLADEAGRCGLRAIVQEKLAWGESRLTDAFSLVVAAGGARDRRPRVVDNVDFMREADVTRELSELWGVPSQPRG